MEDSVIEEELDFQQGFLHLQDEIKKHRSLLVERIDPDFGLLDKLYSNETLSVKEMRSLKCKSDACERNEKLLCYILKKNKTEELIAALRDNGQTHLVNYLTGDGEYNSNFGEEWPLGEKEMKTLRANHGSLIDLIDIGDLCVRLYSKEVINVRQKEFVSSYSRNFERNEALLDIVGRFSGRQFRILIDCLHESNQSHIAEILTEGGVSVRLHANLERAVCSEVTVDEAEDEIIRGMSDLLEGKSPEEASRLMELTMYRIFAVRKGHSIVLYFRCKTWEELIRFHDALRAGHLKVIVQKVFSQFLPIVGVTALKWSEDEFNRQQSDCFLNDFLQTTLYDLPLEALDMILLKILLISMLDKRRKDADIICASASVDECWSKRILRPRFKQRILSHLYAFSRQTSIRKAEFVRKNRSYLAENMKPKGLLNRFRSTDCLTDRETRYINAQKQDIDKNYELLNVMRSLNAKQYNGFIYCLLETGQDDVALVVAHGVEDSINYRTNAILVNSISTRRKKQVSGVAILEEEIFILTGRTSQAASRLRKSSISSEQISVVEIYNRLNLGFLRSWNFYEVLDAWDMVASTRSKCLFIVGWINKGIPSQKIVRVDPNGNIVSQWSTGHDCGYLSVTYESNVVLCAPNSNILKEYSPDGKLIHQIDLTSDSIGNTLCFPLHAIKLTSRHFVVSHGSVNRLQGGVSIVDLKGNVLKSFNGSGSSSEWQEEGPTNLAVDDEGSSFVLDQENGRVFLLSSALEFRREIVSGKKSGLRNSLKINLDQSNGRLFVADNNIGWSDGRLLIFSIK